MLELGFLEEIKVILKECNASRQTLMFSATLSQNIKKLAKNFLKSPAVVEVSDRRDVVNFINHKAYKVDKKRKPEFIATLLNSMNVSQVLLFTTTKESANTLYDYLKKEKIYASILHGDIKKSSRGKSLALLKAGKTRILVATDIAARGLDIPQLPLVINYDLPQSTDDFTHRTGRTGRANHKGLVISLLTIFDYNGFSKIEKDLKLNVKREIYEGFELTDKQPRQAQPRKKSLREKKGYIDYDKRRKYTYAAQKKKKEETRKKK